MREKILFTIIKTILEELFKIWEEKHVNNSMAIINSKRSFMRDLENEFSGYLGYSDEGNDNIV